MHLANSNPQFLPMLSAKDYQLVSKTFRKVSELYYENPREEEFTANLICLTGLVPMIVPSRVSNNDLTILSQMEILKAKARNSPALTTQLSQTIEHLRNPKYIPIKSGLLIEALKSSQLFIVGCTVVLRYFQVLKQDHSLDWNIAIDSISQKIYECPHLSIDVLNELCKDNQQNVRSIAKSGIFKYISLVYISENIKDKFHLYKAIKLIRSGATGGNQAVRDRENNFAVILLAYEEYAPIISDIFEKCYQDTYCSEVVKRDIYGQCINCVFGWSYTESFCKKQLNQSIIHNFSRKLEQQVQSGQYEAKVFTIFSNYSKFCKVLEKDLLRSFPHHQQSLLSYFKLCLNMSQVLPSTPYLINWNELNSLLQANSNPKVAEIVKYLQDLMSKEIKVGVLNANLRKIFCSEKNTDLMLQKASKRPKNNEELQNIKDILNQKDRSNEFDSDTLRMAKDKALDSLRDAIAHETQLDINSILRAIELNDVYLGSKLFQIVELYLVIFEDAIETIDLKRIIEMISWIEDNYHGQIIDWGSISQVLLMLVQEDQWKKHMKTFPNCCFWLLSIDEFSQGDEKELWESIRRVSSERMSLKMPFVLGFLGKVLNNAQKVEYLKNHRAELLNLVNNLAKNQDYELSAMMLSYFLRGWGEEEENYDPEKHKKIFEQLIAPIDNILSSHLRLIPQDYYLLESCLPYKIHIGNKVSTDLESLVKSNGKLASYIYKEQGSQRKNKISDTIVSLNSQSTEQIYQSMIFAQKCPNFIKAGELNSFINHISEDPNNYWQMYPRYVNVISNILKVLGNSDNQSIQNSLTNLSEKLISQIISNKNITDDQKQQLLQEVRDSFQNMKKRGVYIQIERIKKIVTRIVEKEIRDEIIVILNNYKIKEKQKIEIKMIEEQEEEEKQFEQFHHLPLSIQTEVKEEKPRKDFKFKDEREYKHLKEEFSAERVRQSTVIMTNQSEDQEEAISSIVSVEKQFQSIKSSNSTSLLQVFEVLKKIVNKELPFSKFHQIHEIFLQHELNESQKQLLGSLLAKLYHMENHPSVLGLLLDKDKTVLSKEEVFELVSAYIPAFALSRRWKLLSREYLDIAMKRVTQGFLGEGCLVANHNLVKILDLQYFYSKKYHQIVTDLTESVSLQDEIAHFLGLIGMAARFPQIKSEWVSQKLHLKIFKFIMLFPKSVKVIGNLSFAESALTFEENGACVDLVKRMEQMYLVLDGMLVEPTHLFISQYGSLFIGNLSFSKCFNQCPGFDIEKVIKVLLVIFQANLSTQNLAAFKHLLKALGNMSLIPGCSAMILDQKFCNNMVAFAEKIDIMTFYDEKKGKYIKLLLDLISNLATNRDLGKLQILHKSKITLLTITLLQTIQTTHTDLIASCIDAIDAICQDPGLQSWYVSEKKLSSILLDILKHQSEDKLIVKAVRLITNLTLHQNCISHILKSNVLGVIANIIVPQLSLRNIAQGDQQTSRKIQMYIFKIIMRIYQTKPKPAPDLILKSGFLDCLVRLIEMTDVDEKFLDILFHYSPYIPNFLNKRAFSSMIKILTLKVTNQQILIKCLQGLKNILSFTYDVEEEDTLIKGIPEMYMKFLSTEFTIDALFLLAYHLLRSQQFREVLRKPDDKLQAYLRTLSKEQEYLQLCRAIFFLIYNASSMHLFLDDNDSKQIQYYDILKKGFRCKLYRTDGSYKDAVIDIDQEYTFRVYKYPDGQIKRKYVVNIRHIRQFEIQYQSNPDLWKQSVFTAEKGFFNTNNPQSNHCCTLVGNSKWGEIHLINIEFNSLEEKLLFFKCLSHLLSIFRL